MIPKFQKLKLLFFFSCFLIFSLSTFIFPKFVLAQAKADNCICNPNEQGITSTSFQDTSEKCNSFCGGADKVQSFVSPAEGAELEKKLKEEKGALTCVPSPECTDRWQKAKEGILRNISVVCYCCGDCGLNDIVNLFVGAANYLFGIVGALALLFFIYGGVLWLTAGGKAEQIEKGKKVLIGAVIGLVIIFGSWILVQFIMEALGVESEFRKIFEATR